MLRFIAAIIVILYHCSKKSDFLKTVPKFLIAGQEMVTFFFVLSGFVLVLAYYSRETFSRKTFYVKRIARIFPVYLIALFLSAAIGLGGERDPVALVLDTFLLQSWVPPYPTAINTPAWFLSDLMFFYASFPFVLAYLRNSSPSPNRILSLGIWWWLVTQAVLTILLNTAFYQGYPSWSHDIIFYFPVSHYCSFLLGVAGAYFLVTKKKPFFLSTAQSVLFILISCASLILCIEYQPAINKLLQIALPTGSSFYAPLFLLVIVSFYLAKNTVSAKFSAKPIMVLGEISFSIYILQYPVRDIAHHFIKPFNIPYDIFLLLYIPLLIGIGLVLLHIIEHPVRAYVESKLIHD